MRKALFVLLLLSILLSSCRIPESALAGYDTNPFLEERVINVDNSTLVFFTDAHIGRERNRKDIKRFDGNFISFIRDGGYDVVISGGDMADDGELSEELMDFIDKIKSSASLYLETKGNHDRHPYNYKGDDLSSFWLNSILMADTHVTYADIMESEYGIDSTGRYLISTPDGDISIYILDTSLRSFSSRQLSWLEEAITKDNTTFKILVSHINIVSGGAFDQSLFMTGLGDEGEISRFMEICKKGNVSLVLTGHHHKGNILYGDGSGYTEFNGAAYHRADSSFESDGWWYTLSLDREKSEITIDGYDAETSEKKKSWKIGAKL
ncbi:MAG: metallophosphoesterase [Spirochaetales bacterium]|nr:metallophosphoesterase [Spirochaetales bacterium]